MDKSAQKNTLKNFHIYMSALLFVLCLFFPACYVGESMEAQNSYELLLGGALGIFVAAFAWYANPLFLYALIYSSQTRSIFFSAISLLLALTFISYKRVMRADFDFQPDITSLGWGYFLWVMSISIFFVGQIFRFSNAPNWLIAISVIVPLSVGGYYFYPHYYQRIGSKYNLQLERNDIYDEECKNSGTKIYEEIGQINGIYMDGYASGYHIKDFSWGSMPYEVSVESLVNTGYLQFGEMHNDSHSRIGKKPESVYVRYQKPSEYIESNELTSDVSIFMEYTKYPVKIDFIVAKMTIIDRKNSRKLAESKYVFDRKGNRFCGADGGDYSPKKIIVNVLHLHN